MNFNEMSTHQLLLCINASASNQYIPRGMESLIAAQIIPLGQNIDDKVCSGIKNMLAETSHEVLGYILENIQTKDIHHYFDLIFNLENRYQFDPIIVAHFSYEELIQYLADFLKASMVDDIERSIEIYDDRLAKPWRVLKNPIELDGVDKTIKIPAILERPFFSDIHLNITKQGQAKVIKSSFGQLKSVQQYFGKTKAATGEIFRAKNKVYLRWRDIHQFKLGATPFKSFLGVSYKGEFIPASKLISHEIGLKMIGIEDIDSFKFRINKIPVDVTPKEITHIEINLDTQQMLLTRDVTEDDFHVSRFKKLKLKKGDNSAQIHKIVSFNRGASNFEQIQNIFGTSYTECEKARIILKARGEYGLLGNRNIATGDLISHLVLSSMKLLGFLPLNVQSIGFKPEDVKNPEVSQNQAISRIKGIRKSLSEIIDVSKTPNFTDHNFSRLTKTIKSFLKQENTAEITNQQLKLIIAELEGLILYMDDFFKLNVYQKLDEDLECESSPDLDEEFPEETVSQSEIEDLRLDDQAKNFITENYTFFEKRDLVESALIRIEKILFYNKNIKRFAEDVNYEPDLIIYKNAAAQLKNYRLSSFPSVSLAKAIETNNLEFKDEDEELRFIKFMRKFTQRCHQKALELNKTFHHQFKHTLSELTFIADEKLLQLNDELTFLETPDNKEAAYRTLLEKITTLYHQHLKEKQENIDNLEKEYIEVKARYDRYKLDLEKILDKQYSEDELGAVLSEMPAQLEKMKLDILNQHKIRLTETSPIFNAYLKLYNSAINYFSKFLKYANLLLKALWVHRNTAAFQEVKKQTAGFFLMEKEAILIKIEEFESFLHDESKEKLTQQEIHNLSQEIKSSLIELSKIPAKGLFQDKNRKKETLTPYLTYYKQETDSLSS
ncbi:MAG: hypothetical protein HQ517_01215 [SAR324 cluster bacterium]|nr:hypothetical protein [SAR324 cluster bacterium]